ncbi:MAG: hypothetical protein U1E15_12455 [Hyphomicrobiales bacterium]
MSADPIKTNCKRGQWSLYVTETYEIRDTISNFIDPPGRFWAQNSHGVQVRRNEITRGIPSLFDYRGRDFLIRYKIAPVIDLLQISEAELHILTEEHGREIFPPHVFVNESFSWFNSISSSELLRAISDITDPDLYRCLFECLPTNFESGEPTYFPQEKIHPSIYQLRDRPGGEVQEQFAGIRKMMEQGELFTSEMLAAQLHKSMKYGDVHE